MISGLEPSWTALVARVVATVKIKPQCSQTLEEGVQNERLVALTRKNALLAGSDGGAAHWAVIASLIETCKLIGVEPRAYLADVISRIVTGHPQSRLDELLPWAYPTTPALKAAA